MSKFFTRYQLKRLVFETKQVKVWQSSDHFHGSECWIAIERRKSRRTQITAETYYNFSQTSHPCLQSILDVGQIQHGRFNGCNYVVYQDQSLTSLSGLFDRLSETEQRSLIIELLQFTTDMHSRKLYLSQINLNQLWLKHHEGSVQLMVCGLTPSTLKRQERNSELAITRNYIQNIELLINLYSVNTDTQPGTVSDSLRELISQLSLSRVDQPIDLLNHWLRCHNWTIFIEQQSDRDIHTFSRQRASLLTSVCSQVQRSFAQGCRSPFIFLFGEPGIGSTLFCEHIELNLSLKDLPSFACDHSDFADCSNRILQTMDRADDKEHKQRALVICEDIDRLPQVQWNELYSRLGVHLDNQKTDQLLILFTFDSPRSQRAQSIRSLVESNLQLHPPIEFTLQALSTADIKSIVLQSDPELHNRPDRLQQIIDHAAGNPFIAKQLAQNNTSEASDLKQDQSSNLSETQQLIHKLLVARILQLDKIHQKAVATLALLQHIPPLADISTLFEHVFHDESPQRILQQLESEHLISRMFDRVHHRFDFIAGAYKQDSGITHLLKETSSYLIDAIQQSPFSEDLRWQTELCLIKLNFGDNIDWRQVLTLVGQHEKNFDTLQTQALLLASAAQMSKEIQDSKNFDGHQQHIITTVSNRLIQWRCFDAAEALLELTLQKNGALLTDSSDSDVDEATIGFWQKLIWQLGRLYRYRADWPRLQQLVQRFRSIKQLYRNPHFKLVLDTIDLRRLFHMGDYSTILDEVEQHDNEGDGPSIYSIQHILIEGHALNAIGKYHEATGKYNQSLRISKEVGYDDGIGNALVSMGSIAIQRQLASVSLDQIRTWFYDAERAFANAQNVSGVLDCHMQLGRLALEQCEFTESKNRWDRCLPEIRRAGGGRDLAVVLLEVAELKGTLGRKFERVNDLRQALLSAQAVDANHITVECRLQLALAELEQDHFDDAKIQLEFIVDQSKQDRLEAYVHVAQILLEVISSRESRKKAKGLDAEATPLQQLPISTQIRLLSLLIRTDTKKFERYCSMYLQLENALVHRPRLFLLWLHHFFRDCVEMDDRYYLQAAKLPLQDWARRISEMVKRYALTLGVEERRLFFSFWLSPTVTKNMNRYLPEKERVVSRVEQLSDKNALENLTQSLELVQPGRGVKTLLVSSLDALLSLLPFRQCWIVVRRDPIGDNLQHFATWNDGWARCKDNDMHVIGKSDDGRQLRSRANIILKRLYHTASMSSFLESSGMGQLHVATPSQNRDLHKEEVILSLPIVYRGFMLGFVGGPIDTTRIPLVHAQSALQIFASQLKGLVLMEADTLQINLPETALIESALSDSLDHELLDQLIFNSRATDKSAATLKVATEQLKSLKNSDSTLLIEGEAGTGKATFARIAHTQSQRHESPLIVVDCANIDDNIFEARFFGHKKGSFTGAHQDQIGFFEAANSGALLLLQIEELSLVAQAKVLRAIQDRVIHRVGELRERPIDIRLIATCAPNISRLVDQGRFRADLFYRLDVVRIQLPSLRERTDDIALLAHTFLQRYCKNRDGSHPQIGADVMNLLKAYSWPGNVSELELEMKRIATLHTDLSRLDKVHLNPRIVRRALESENIQMATLTVEESGHLQTMLDQYEKRIIQSALLKNDGNVAQTATDLGLPRSTLRNKIAKHDLP